MKGFVPTPEKVVDIMVDKLFSGSYPSVNDIVLDPGCGTGAFIDGIIRWSHKTCSPLPNIVGIESDPKHITAIGNKYCAYPNVDIRHEDFLTRTQGSFDYVIGNPPYIPITKLSEEEKATYRRLYHTAQGRFDLYMLFFERSLNLLREGGRIVFITPEKYLYVASASKLREMLGKRYVFEVHMVDEGTFGDLTTYPTITTVINSHKKAYTNIIFRNGHSKKVKLTSDGKSWLPLIYGMNNVEKHMKLSDVALRVSCGVATGADSIFVKKTNELSPDLSPYAYPTISGKQLNSTETPYTDESMISPYTKDGKLISETKLGRLRDYLKRPDNFKKLNDRTCVSRKPWYSFHENPPMTDLLRPKILCKDITAKPRFWIDKEGKLIPRHSVYYIVPKDEGKIDMLCKYLNTKEVSTWLEANCQRAANGFLRLQSNILKNIPISIEAFNMLSDDT